MLNLIFAFVGWFILCGWACSLLWLVWLIYRYDKAEKAFWEEHGAEIATKAGEMIAAKIEERRKEAKNNDNT